MSKNTPPEKSTTTQPNVGLEPNVNPKPNNSNTPVKPTPPRRRRRYGKRLANTICRRLARGESLTRICADSHMPGYSTVMDWLAAQPDFRKMYSQARTLQAHALADEVLAVLRSDRMPPADKQVRIKGLCWLASKLHPAKYSEKGPSLAEQEGETTLTVIVQPHLR